MLYLPQWNLGRFLAVRHFQTVKPILPINDLDRDFAPKNLFAKFVKMDRSFGLYYGLTVTQLTHSDQYFFSVLSHTIDIFLLSLSIKITLASFAHPIMVTNSRLKTMKI